MAPCMRNSAPVPAKYWTPTRSSASSRWFAAIRQKGKRGGAFGSWLRKPSSGNWCRASVERPFASCCGTANVFCAVEPKAGRHFTFPTWDRSAFEFARFACNLAMQYPAAKTIHLVMDNLNTHRRKSLTDVFGEHVGGDIWGRFTVHYTPKHGSWLNQAE